MPNPNRRKKETNANQGTPREIRYASPSGAPSHNSAQQKVRNSTPTYSQPSAPTRTEVTNHTRDRVRDAAEIGSATIRNALTIEMSRRAEEERARRAQQRQDAADILSYYQQHPYEQWTVDEAIRNSRAQRTADALEELTQRQKAIANEQAAQRASERGMYLGTEDSFTPSTGKQNPLVDQTWKQLRNREDYAQNSQYRDNGNAEAALLNNDETMKQLYNRVGAMAQGMTGAGSNLLPRADVEEYLNDNERNTYNYILNTYGQDAADRYYRDTLEPTLNRRWSTEYNRMVSDATTSNPAMAALTSVLSVPGKNTFDTAVALDELAGYGVSKLTGRPMDTNNPFLTMAGTFSTMRNAVQQDVNEKYGEWGGMAYGTAMSIMDNLYQIGMAGGFEKGATEAAKKQAETLTLGLMGTGAAAGSIKENLESGMDMDRAVVLGLGSGLIEVITEKIGMDNLFQGVWRGKNFFMSLMKQMAAEGAEEGLSDIINWGAEGLYDMLSKTDEASWKKDFAEKQEQNPDLTDDEVWGLVYNDMAKEFGMDIIGGAVSGLFLGGTMGAKTNIEFNKIAEDTSAKVSAQDASRIIEYALESEDPATKRAAEKLQAKIDGGYTPTDEDIQKLANKSIKSELYTEMESPGKTAEKAYAKAVERYQADKKDAMERMSLNETEADTYLAAKAQSDIKDTEAELRLREEFVKVYKNGENGNDFESIQLGENPVMSEETRRWVYETAKFNKEISTDLEGQTISIDTVRKGEPVKEFVTYKNPGVIQSKALEKARADGRLSIQTEARIDRLAKAFGTKVVFVESIVNEKGESVANGEYNNGVIVLALDSTFAKDSDFAKKRGGWTQDLAYNLTFGHELTHRLQEVAPEAYARLRDAAIDARGENVVLKQVGYQIRLNEKANSKLTQSEAMDEVLADFIAYSAYDNGAFKKYAQGLAKDSGGRTALGKLRDGFRELLGKLKGVSGWTSEKNGTQKLINIIDAALREGTANVKKAEKTEMSDKQTLARVQRMGGKMSAKEITAKTGVNSELAEVMEKGGYQMPDHGAYSVRTEILWDEALKTLAAGHENTQEYRNAVQLVHSMTKQVLNDAEMLNFVPTGLPSGNPLRSNIEYIVTFDMDALCPRTYEFGAYRDAVEKRLGRKMNEKEARALIENLRAYGMMIPCTYCYVESKRMALNTAYNKYFELYDKIAGAKTDKQAYAFVPENAYNHKTNTWKKDTKGWQDRFKGWRALKNNKYNTSPEELFEKVSQAEAAVYNWLDSEYDKPENYIPSKDGFKDFKLPQKSKTLAALLEHFGIEMKESAKRGAQIQIEGMLEQWLYDMQMGLPHNVNPEFNDSTEVDAEALDFHHEALKYAKSSSQAHGVDNYAPYSDQILNLTTAQKAVINARGGIRKHSSNDFRLDNLVDYVQFYTHLALDKRGGFGWFGHTYTKDTLFAELFAPTNDRINMSIAMFGDGGRLGEIRPNLAEGADWNEVKRLRNKYDNLGAMAMVTNNAQLSYALNSDWIDMIIPFHASGMTKELYSDVMAWYDYTSVQSDKLYTNKQLKEMGINPAKITRVYEYYKSKEAGWVTAKKPRQVHFLPGDQYIGTKGETYLEHLNDKNYKGNLKAEYDELIKSGNIIPGHENNAEKYLKLCKQYGVKPRFSGIQVQDADGNTIDITEHPNYVKVLKETARTDTKQKEITMEGFDLNYAMSQLKARSAHGGYNTVKGNESIVDDFVENVIGKKKPVGYVTAKALATKFASNPAALAEIIDENGEYLTEGMTVEELREFELNHPVEEKSLGSASVRMSAKTDSLGSTLRYVIKEEKEKTKYGTYNTFYHVVDTLNPNRYIAITESRQGAEQVISLKLGGKENRIKETGNAKKPSTKRRKGFEGDSQGRELSPGQQKYFKDSKVRDENGNLKVMYHGTENAGFTIFDPGYSNDGISLFFTDNPTVAKGYSGSYDAYTPGTYTLEEINEASMEVGNERQIVKTDEGYEVRWQDRVENTFDTWKETEQFMREQWGEIFEEGLESNSGNYNYEVYLDVKNPLVVDAQGYNWEELGLIDGAIEGLETTRDYAEYALENGYDGVIFKNIYDSAIYATSREALEASTVVVAFNSNQVKATNNLNPTEDPDIRYSAKEDSLGRTLSLGQIDYFKDSKVRDDEGRLLTVYHTTNSGGFTVFDPRYSDDRTSLFFATNFDVSQTYGTNAKQKVALEKPNYSSLEDFEKDYWRATRRPYGSTLVKDFTIRIYENEYNTIATDLGKTAQERFDAWNSLSEEEASKYTINMEKPYAPGRAKATSKAELLRVLEEAMSQRTEAGYYECYLNLTNPLIVDANGAVWSSIPYDPNATAKRSTVADVRAKLEKSMSTAVFSIETDTNYDEEGNGPFSITLLIEMKKKDADGEWKDANVRKTIGLDDEGKYIDEDGDFDQSEAAIYLWDQIEKEIRNLVGPKCDQLIEQLYTDVDISFDGEAHYKAINPTGYNWFDKEGNQYDLSKENLQENESVPRYNTRGLARLAKKQGYDGVIIKNLYDLGGSSNFVGNDKMSDIVIAFNSNQVKDVNNLNPTDNPDIRYSVKANARSLIENALTVKNIRGDIQLTDNTPAIIAGQKNAKNLPMVMKATHIRENILTEDEAKKLGLKTGGNINYHGLGIDVFMEVLEDLDDIDLAYRGTPRAAIPERRENFFLLVSKHTDSEGNPIIVPVYTDEKTQVNRLFIDVNQIASVYGKSGFETFIKRQLDNHNLVRVTKKASNPVNGTGPIPGGYRNDTSFENTVPQSSSKNKGSNPKTSLKTEMDSYEMGNRLQALEKQNEVLAERVTYYQNQRRRTNADSVARAKNKVPVMDTITEKAAKEIAKDIVKTYNAAVPTGELATQLRKASLLMVREEARPSAMKGTSEQTINDAIWHVACDMAEKVLENSREIPKAQLTGYREQFDHYETVNMLANDILSRMLDAEKVKPTEADRNAMKLEQTRKKARKDLSDAIKRERENKNKAIQELKDHHREVAERRKQRRVELEARQKLLNVADRLYKLKTSNANKDHIQQTIRKMIGGDLSTVYKTLTGDRLDNLMELKAKYDELKKDDSFLRDEATEARIDDMYKKHVNDLTLDEVISLTEVLKNIEAALRLQNKTIEEDYNRDKFEQGNEIIEAIGRTRGMKLEGINKMIVNEVIRPETMFKRIIGYDYENPLWQKYQQLEDGQLKMISYQNDANKLFDNFIKDKNFWKRMTGKNAEEVTIRGIDNETNQEVEVKITPAMRMSIYLHSLNDDNMRHIQEGGLTVPDITAYKKGKVSKAYDKATTIRLTKGYAMSLYDQMSAKEKAYIGAVQEYFNGMSTPAINEVSNQLKGYDIAKVGNYFPINTDTTFSRTAFGEMKFDGSIEGMGWTKERVHAKNPILLIEAEDVVTRAIRDHSKYVGMAIPVFNFNQVMGVNRANFDSEGNYAGTQTSVQKAIKKKWGGFTLDYLNNLMNDLQNPKSINDTNGAWFSRLQSKYAGGVLELNASVAIKQAASLPTACAVLGYRSVMRAMLDVGKVNTNVYYKYSPLGEYRERGYISQEHGDIKEQGIKMPKGLAWINAIDSLTVRKLFKASEYYVQREFPNLTVGSEAYWRKVGEVHTDVITQTQPNYTPLQRPQILRTQNTLVRALNMFKTQPFQNFNILFDAAGEFRATGDRYKMDSSEANLKAHKAAGKKLARAISSQLLSALVFALMQAAWDLFRKKDDKYRDDEGELTVGSFMKKLGLNMLTNAGGMLPWMNSILEYGESLTDTIAKALGKEEIFGGQRFYGMEVGVLSNINDTLDGISSAVTKSVKYFNGDEKVTGYDAIGAAVDAIADVGTTLGLPANNVKNEAYAIYNWMNQAITGQETAVDSKTVFDTETRAKTAEAKEMANEIENDPIYTRYMATREQHPDYKKAEYALDKTAQNIEFGKYEKYEKFADMMTKDEFILYELALQIADMEGDANGSYKQAERQKAMDMLDFLTNQEKSTIWTEKLGYKKNNPYN